MNADAPAWNRGRWLRLIAILFAGHLFLAWALAERVIPPPRQTPKLAPVILLTSPQANDALARYPEVAGSTLFALVDPHGVSGSAWLRTEPRNIPLTEWREPDFYLSPNPDRLGVAFRRFTETNNAQFSRASELPPLPPPTFLASQNPPMTKSLVTVRGPLAERQLLTPLNPPTWPLAGTLRDTEVRVAIDANGEIFSATQESMEPKSVDLAQQQADQKAVQLTLQMRFSPAPTRKPNAPIGSDLTWGTVVFRWATTAPTNSLPLNP